MKVFIASRLYISLRLFIMIMVVITTAEYAFADYDVTISSAVSANGSWSGGQWTPSAAGSNVSALDIKTRLEAGTSVLVTTAGGGTENGDIMVTGSVGWSANSTLTLSALRNVNVNAGITATGATAGLILTPSNTAAGGSYVLNNGGVITLSGTTPGLIIAGNAFTVINDVTALQNMGSALSGRYALGSNIDASATATWNSGAGFLPIGNSTTNFTGTFDGFKHTITGLTINRPVPEYAGLFGAVGVTGIVRNVGLTGGSVSGSEYSSNAAVGGLAGYNYGSISNSYNTGSVVNVGRSFAGGLVGTNIGSISNSYATGNVTIVESRAGGLVGHNGGTISNCYATGNVYGGCCANAGLVGHNAGSISNSYSTGSASGWYQVGGFVGEQSGGPSYSNNFWDVTTSGMGGGYGATGLTTAQMQTAGSFTGFDFTNTWWLSEGNTRPFLRSEHSSAINNAHQLQLMGMNATTLAASYTLDSDINMAELTQASSLWNTATGFVPVGNSTTKFTGNFDGLGHTITGLFINRPLADYAGLFGYTDGGSSISNVGIVNANITGGVFVGALVGEKWSGSVSHSFSTGVMVSNSSSPNSIVGGLVGRNQGAISNSYSTASATGNYDNAGGLVGINDVGTISNCYSTGAAYGRWNVGGFVGTSYGTINNSYSTGTATVTGSNVGGFSGNILGGSVNNSYWDMTTSGLGSSRGGGSGLNTAQMMAQANFTGWDFISIWHINEGSSYPLLNPADTTPGTFTFTEQSNVALSTLATSNTITTSGINAAAAISISGGQYQINSGTWVSSAGTVNNGDTVTVRQTSSASYSTKTDITLAIGGVIGTFSVTTAAPPPPVALWHADNNASDSNGSNHGTLVNGAYAAGMVGQAFSLDGTSSYVTIPNGIIPATARNFSIDAWVYPEDVTAQRQIFYGGSGGGEYQLGAVGNNYYFKINLTTGGWIEVSTPATVNQWAFVTGVRRGTSLELWVDGVLKSSTTISDLDLYAPGAGNNSRIGAYNEFNTNNKEYWKGLIDEVEIYNRSLSLAEIGTIYNSGCAGKCTATYTVTYNSNGGSAVSSQSVAYNITATLPTTPTKTGFTFTGWYSDSGLTSAFAFTTPTTADITLYAKWTINPISGVCGTSNGAPFTIAPASNLCTFGTASAVSGTGPWNWTCGGINGGSTASCSAYLQGTVVLPKTGQTLCYNTAGTQISCSGTGQDGDKQAGTAQTDPLFTDNGNGTISDKVYGMTWQKDAGLNGTVIPTGIVGVPAMRFTDNLNGTQTDNLTGLVWLKDAGCLGMKTWVNALTSANTLVGDNSQCTLNDGSVAGDWRLPNIDELASVATNYTGGSPSDWLNNAAQGFINVQDGFHWSSTTYAYASYTDFAWSVLMYDGYVGGGPKSSGYYVWPVRGGALGSLALSKSGTGTGSVSSTPAGISCGATCSASFAKGQQVVLTATADGGSAFTAWAGCDNTDVNKCTVAVSGAKSVTATFELTYTVSFTSNGGTVVSNQSVAYNTVATAPTPPTKTGSTFAGWYSDAGLTAAFAFTTAITTDTTLYAKWTINSYTVTPSAGTGSSTNPATGQSVNHGATTSFTISPNAGYGILSVTGCGGTLTGNTYTTGTITGICTVSVTAVKRSGNGGSGAAPTVADALKALQAYYNLITLTPTEMLLYDVAPLAVGGIPQGNNVIDIADVILILRRSVGIGSW